MSDTNPATLPPLPSWITEKYPNCWEVDIDAYLAAGGELPIQLGDIPQFAGFWTMPYATMPRGSSIVFKPQSPDKIQKA
jgi:hypothetical protein